MATSNSTNFSMSRDDIIKRALRMLGVLAQGETPTADQVTEAAVALNGLVKAWQADGMPLWALKQTTITLLDGINTYEIGLGKATNIPKPLKVIQAWNRNTTSSVDIPMRIVTKQEYNMLGNKTSSGTPIQVYYEPLADYGVLRVFPTPAATDASSGSVYIVYQRPFEDFDASSDTPDFPQEWYDSLTYGLAVRLAPEYGVPSTDRKALFQEMTIIKQEALNFGLEEGSLFFSRDTKNW